MSLAIDASTPAAATANTGATVNDTITNCPSSAGLVGLSVHNVTSGTTNADSTVTDDKSLTWTQFAKRGEFDVGASPGLAAAAWARNAASIQTIVATATGTNCRGEVAFLPLVFTGIKTSGSFIGAVSEASSDNTDNLSVSVTTTADGSMVVLVCSDWWAETTYVGGTGFQDYSAVVNGNIGYWFCYKTAVVTSSGTTVTFDPTNASHTARNNAIAFEVLADTSGGATTTPEILIPTTALMRAGSW